MLSWHYSLKIHHQTSTDSLSDVSYAIWLNVAFFAKIAARGDRKRMRMNEPGGDSRIDLGNLI